MQQGSTLCHCLGDCGLNGQETVNEKRVVLGEATFGMEAPEITQVSGLRERLRLSDCRSWVGGAFGQLHRSRGELVWWSGQCVLSVWLNEKLGGSAGGWGLQRGSADSEHAFRPCPGIDGSRPCHC